MAHAHFEPPDACMISPAGSSQAWINLPRHARTHKASSTIESPLLLLSSAISAARSCLCLHARRQVMKATTRTNRPCYVHTPNPSDVGIISQSTLLVLYLGRGSRLVACTVCTTICAVTTNSPQQAYQQAILNLFSHAGKRWSCKYHNMARGCPGLLWQLFFTRQALLLILVDSNVDIGVLNTFARFYIVDFCSGCGLVLVIRRVCHATYRSSLEGQSTYSTAA